MRYGGHPYLSFDRLRTGAKVGLPPILFGRGDCYAPRMKNLSFVLGSAVLAALPGGCAGHSAVIPAQVTSLAPPMAQLFEPDVTTPPACKGQKKKKLYAFATEPLSKKGGSLCIPAFGGYGGTVVYPHVTTSTKVTVTSSTTNYAKVPLPISGSQTPIFFFNLSISASTGFTTKLGIGGGLTSKKIKVKQTYTAFIEGERTGFWHGVTQCYTVAKSGKYGGVLPGLGSLLKGLSDSGFSGYDPFEIFIYTGQLANNQC